MKLRYLDLLKNIQQGLKEYDGPIIFRLPQATRYLMKLFVSWQDQYREPLIMQIRTMHTHLNQLFETIAQWARGQWSTDNRARLADILLPFSSSYSFFDSFQILHIVESLPRPIDSVEWIRVLPRMLIVRR